MPSQIQSQSPLLLPDGEAEEYSNVEVEYVHGRKAILYIYHDGEEAEQITLSEYKTKEDMHNLMAEKGFVKKPEEELAEMRERRLQREQARQKAEEQKLKAQEKRNNVQGLGVDFVEADTVEEVAEEKSRVWGAGARAVKEAEEANNKANRPQKLDYKKIALEAEREEKKILDAEKRARRLAMEL